MTSTVCLLANTLRYPHGGGHFWVYLNWALGLEANDCRVIWLEAVSPDLATTKVHSLVKALKDNLRPFGLEENIALCRWSTEPSFDTANYDCSDILAAAEADLLISLSPAILSEIVLPFRRSVFIDIDPGRLQIWVHQSEINLAPYDLYFSIGETVGTQRSRFPSCGLDWHYTPPCISLEHWTIHSANENALFTTVGTWESEWFTHGVSTYPNDKRTSLQPFLTLPRCVNAGFELALGYANDEDRSSLAENGWAVRNAYEICRTPLDYQRYIQESLGEFSCAKPSCIHLANAWISDRTLCYLASGKPAVVQHTGPSGFLPDSSGIFRFTQLEDAIRYIDIVINNYDAQCQLARELAEEYFDAAIVTRRVLGKALA